MPRSGRRSIQGLFLYAFLSAAAYVIGRSVADGLFVSTIGPEALPVMHVASAVAMAVLSFAYLRLAKRTRVETLASVCSLVLATAGCAAPILLRRSPGDYWTLAALYVLAEVRGGLGSILLGTLMNERVSPEQAPRTYGFIGAGATLAGVVFGCLVAFEVHTLHAENLLYVGAAVDLLTVVPLLLTRRSRDGTITGFARHRRVRPGAARRARLRRWHALATSPYAVALVAIAALQTASSLFVEYQWKSAASLRFSSPDAVTGFFGQYYAAIYLATGMLQLLATGHFLARFGHAVGLLVFPGHLLVASLCLLVLGDVRSTFALTTFAKSCDAFKRSLNDPALQILYSFQPAARRREVLTFVTGVVKPFSEAAAGAAIMQLEGFGATRLLPAATVALVGIWLAVVIGLARRSRRFVPVASTADAQ